MNHKTFNFAAVSVLVVSSVFLGAVVFWPDSPKSVNAGTAVQSAANPSAPAQTVSPAQPAALAQNDNSGDFEQLHEAVSYPSEYMAMDTTNEFPVIEISSPDSGSSSNYASQTLAGDSSSSFSFDVSTLSSTLSSSGNTSSSSSSEASSSSGGSSGSSGGASSGGSSSGGSSSGGSSSDGSTGGQDTSDNSQDTSEQDSSKDTPDSPSLPGIPNNPNAYFVSPTGNDRNDGRSVETPFATIAKAIQTARPGDTVYLRGGIYRQSISLGADTSARFNTNASKSARITFQSFPNEQAVITSMQLRNSPQYWRQVPGYSNVYMTDITPNQIKGSAQYKPERVPNCSQDGIPLKLMTEIHSNGGPELLKGPGQWVRDTRTDVLKIYVWSRDGLNPGLSQTEICEFPSGGTGTIMFQRSQTRSGRPQPDYITLEDLTIEGGYDAITIETNYIEIKNCTVRNCYADALKISGAEPDDPDNPDQPLDLDYFNSEYGVIENCDICDFGEQGIDVTGGDYWTIQSNRIHNNASNRGTTPAGTAGNGIILKNNCIGTVVRNNQIYDIDSLYGAITIGGSSWGNIADEAVDCTVQGNEIYNITGPYVVLFMAAKNCTFRENVVRDCSVTDALIRFACGDTTKTNYKNRNCSIVSNIFRDNNVLTGLMYRIPAESVVNLASDYNTIPQMKYFLNDKTITIQQFRRLGYEKNASVANLSD
ncbi:MAG TPA: right-handed parallel beta-helix repeat-containing protein [Anaerohalosphaeraceae bacterium]|nr:right-handed parallel beta-helix repeat-containing protein [Anaerohalosphaeraceae bacterium]